MVVTKNLTNIIYKYKDSKFNWKDFDCCIFTVSVVEEYTNRTLPYWREVITYTSYIEAMKALKKLGCKDLIDLPSIILETDRKPISDVKLGEPVYYKNEEEKGILGVCNGAQAYFLSKDKGLTTRKIEDCLYCWSID
jgi:hypothetical protein